MLIRERVDGVLRDQLGPGFEWTGETCLTGDDDSLNLDSLDLTELVMRLEEEFVVAIPDDACAGLEDLTVERLCEMIDARTATKPAFHLG